MNLRKVLVVLMAVAVMMPFSLNAASQNSNSGRGRSSNTEDKNVSELMEKIKNLQGQLNNLQTQKSSVSVDMSGKMKVRSAGISRMLGEGASGEDVMVLQAILAADAEIYPEGVISGVYGPLTKKAVERFQKKHSLEAVGTIGPRTLAILQRSLETTPIAFESSDSLLEDTLGVVGDDNSGPKRGRLCAKVPPGHLIAPGWLRRNAAPVVPACQTLPPGIVKILTGRSTSTSTTTSDRTAPRIRNLTATNIEDDSAEITWTTNESATSKVYYSSSTPVNLNTAQIETSDTLTRSHSVTLDDLNEDTLYYYVAESADAAGNTTRGATKSFRTDN